jgi:hypothetical protein
VPEITIERLKHAIAVTAYVMVRHDLPQLLPTLKRLESARDDLARDGDALDYAKRVLERGAISVESPAHYKMLPSPALADAA